MLRFGVKYSTEESLNWIKVSMILVFFSSCAQTINNSKNFAVDCVENYCHRFKSGEQSPISIKKDVYGKPHVSISGVYVSISHVSGCIACAVAATPIGVDVERIHQEIKEPLKSKLASLKEQNESLIDFWTRIESFSKLIGCGLSYGIDYLVKEMNTGNFCFRRLELATGYTCSLCTCGNICDDIIVKSE